MRLWAVVVAAMFALVLTSAVRADEPRVALVVGVGDYAGAPQLRNPVPDANLVADTLRGVGFDVELVTDPGQREMEDAVIRLKNRMAAAGADAIGLFYFAGHGIQSAGINYLVPADASLESEDYLATRTVPAQWVLAAMETAGAAASFVVLDACRNDPFSRSWVSSTRSAATHGLAQMEPPRGSFLVFSTAPGAVALDGDGANSPFAEAIADELISPGVLAETMFKRVVRQVEDKTGDAQSPWVQYSFNGDFYFGGPPSGGEAGEDGGLPASAQLENMFWNLIKDSDDPDDFREYVENFPEGIYLEDAEARIAELEAAEPAPDPETEPSALRVVDLTLSATPNVYEGLCPATIGFTGRISAVGGAGVVAYRWLRSDGATGPIETVSFTGPGTKEISSAWSVGAEDAKFEGWRQLEVLDPTAMKSGQATFIVACQTPEQRDVYRIPQAELEERLPSIVEQAKRDPRVLTRVRERDPRLADAAVEIIRKEEMEAAARSTRPVTDQVVYRPLQLPAPTLISPDDGYVFDLFPRNMTLRWGTVDGAASYIVEIDCMHCCASGQWCADLGREYKVHKGVTEPYLRTTFVGAQPGRWRVGAVAADGTTSPMSPWREFIHKR